ncbi:hypothetical protein GCM10027612_84250 [Microbispora bryophytorum subsp. camponoti]
MPSASVLPVTSRHRPDCALTSGAAAADAGIAHTTATASTVASAVARTVKKRTPALTGERRRRSSHEWG